MAQLFKTDGSVTEIAPKNGRTFTLEELHALVGGYIEVVAVPPWDGSRLAVCDEEGKLKEKPFNELATYAAERPDYNDVAVGDWLFADRTELEGEVIPEDADQGGDEDDEDEDDEDDEVHPL